MKRTLAFYRRMPVWCRAVLLVCSTLVLPCAAVLLAGDASGAEKPAAAPLDSARAVGEVKGDPTAKRVLRVRVVLPDGKPAAGAKIQAAIWAKEPTKTNQDYVCDAQGQAIVELPKSIDILRLWARMDGYVPLFAHWESQELKAGGRIPAEFTFKLEKGTVIGGFVKNEDGQPIAGAKVEVRLPTSMDEQQKRVLFTTWLAEGEEARTTDAQGRWTLDNVPKGDNVEVTVRLSHPDYISDYRWGVMQHEAKVTTAMLRQQTGTIVMARGIRVTGSVTNPSGKPVPGAVVVWGDDPYMMEGSQEVRTDERGIYRFPPLPPMPTTVTVMAEGRAPELKKVAITRENPPVDFQLKPGKTLRLRFVDNSGKPVPEVYVGINGWRGGKSLYNEKHPNVLDTKIPRQADKNGLYEWTWAPEDAVEYGFGKEGYRTIEDQSIIADGRDHEIRLSR
jgi:uncharacterized GH25 family protein